MRVRESFMDGSWMGCGNGGMIQQKVYSRQSTADSYFSGPLKASWVVIGDLRWGCVSPLRGSGALVDCTQGLRPGWAEGAAPPALLLGAAFTEFYRCVVVHFLDKGRGERNHLSFLR